MAKHWLQVDWRKHPRAGELPHEAIEEQVFMASVERGALVTKGSWFYADEGYREQDGMFFRATFAAAPFDQIDLAIQRFGAAVRDVFGLEAPGLVVGNGIQREGGPQNGVRQQASALEAGAKNEKCSGLEVSVQNGSHQQDPQNGCNGHA